LSFQFSKVLFHIGNPLEVKPHYNLSIIEKFIQKNSDWALIIVLRTEEERTLLEEKMKGVKLPEYHPGGFLFVWKDDEELMDMFCRDLHFCNTWNAMGPIWYKCKDKGHILSQTLEDRLEKCTECQGELEVVELEKERGEKFGKILENAVLLMKFDTRSAKILTTQVNPTANVMRNMPMAIGCPEHPALRMEDYAGIGKGKVAVCVSAGPSLKHAIPHLRRLQDQIIIISVARVFKLLKDAGIRQDYTLNCEMFSWDSAIFDGFTKEFVGDTVFLYPPVCAPDTVAKWPGQKVCCFDLNAAELIGNRLAMTGGNSVSHHIYNWAAEILKCDRVILVGQDLSYTEPTGETHVLGSQPDKWPDACKAEDLNQQNEAWDECQTQDGPFHGEKVHRQSIAVEAGGMIPVGPVLVRTSPAYMRFRDLMDILIKRHKVKTYNACPNGLKLNRAEYVNLEKLESVAQWAVLGSGK